jgi:hypothetical protein
MQDFFGYKKCCALQFTQLNVVSDCVYWRRQKRGQGTELQT